MSFGLVRVLCVCHSGAFEFSACVVRASSSSLRVSFGRVRVLCACRFGRGRVLCACHSGAFEFSARVIRARSSSLRVSFGRGRVLCVCHAGAFEFSACVIRARSSSLRVSFGRVAKHVNLIAVIGSATDWEYLPSGAESVDREWRWNTTPIPICPRHHARVKSGISGPLSLLWRWLLLHSLCGARLDRGILLAGSFKC